MIEFGQFPLREGEVVLKEIIFYNFNFGKVCLS